MRSLSPSGVYREGGGPGGGQKRASIGERWGKKFGLRVTDGGGGVPWHHGSMQEGPVERGFSLAIEYFREEDGRWLADIAALPGVTAYGRTRKQATAAVQALALRLIADRLEHGEALPAR
ncbi:MAG TPA: type II toxin-antitoxin system HicB family antitoxin [Bryobacteraceae bacterium]|nr:type II toxin-antitoxin system HicB family antitoxin [Bryobacteraceae bacterium]